MEVYLAGWEKRRSETSNNISRFSLMLSRRRPSVILVLIRKRNFINSIATTSLPILASLDRLFAHGNDISNGDEKSNESSSEGYHGANKMWQQKKTMTFSGLVVV